MQKEINYRKVASCFAVVIIAVGVPLTFKVVSIGSYVVWSQAISGFLGFMAAFLGVGIRDVPESMIMKWMGFSDRSDFLSFILFIVATLGFQAALLQFLTA